MASRSRSSPPMRVRTSTSSGSSSSRSATMRRRTLAGGAASRPGVAPARLSTGRGHACIPRPGNAHVARRSHHGERSGTSRSLQKASRVLHLRPDPDRLIVKRLLLGVTVVSLHGQHDVLAAMLLRDRLADLAREGAPLVVDLTSAHVLDEAIVAVVVAAERAAREDG